MALGINGIKIGDVVRLAGYWGVTSVEKWGVLVVTDTRPRSAYEPEGMVIARSLTRGRSLMLLPKAFVKAETGDGDE